jgi:hypothetical protein
VPGASRLGAEARALDSYIWASVRRSIAGCHLTAGESWRRKGLGEEASLWLAPPCAAGRIAPVVRGGDAGSAGRRSVPWSHFGTLKDREESHDALTT